MLTKQMAWLLRVIACYKCYGWHVGNWHSEIQFSKSTMSGNKRAKWKSREHAGTLHPLLYRVVLAPCLLNLRLLGAPHYHPTVPKCLWKEGGREQLLTCPGLWRTPRNTLQLFSWLLWLMLCEVKPSIKWAVMRALTSSQPRTLTCAICGHKQLTLHLAIVKGLSRVGHLHEFPPNLVLHQCNDMMLLK